MTEKNELEIYKLLSKVLPDVMFSIDIDTMKLKYVSKSSEKLIGYTSSEVIGLDIKEIISTSSFELITNTLAREFAKDDNIPRDRFIELDVELKRKDESTMWINISVAFERDEGGKPTGLIGVAKDITGYKISEEVIKEFEQLYRIIVKTSPDAFFIFNRDNQIIEINSRAIELTGYDREELLELEINNLIDPETADVLEKRFPLDDENAYGIEFNIISKEKNKVFVEASVSSIKGSDGEIEAYVCILRDITKRKKAEMAIVKSERTARALLDSISESAILMDIKGGIVAANDKAVGWIVKTVDGLMDNQYDGHGDGFLNLYNYLPHEKEEERKEIVDQMIESGKEVHFLHEVDGKYFDYTLYPVFDDNNEINRVAFLARDVTNQKKALEDLNFRMKFDSLVSTISTNFINIQPMKLGKGIYDSLQSIGELIDADRGYVFTFYKETNLNIIREWCSEGVESVYETVMDEFVDNSFWAMSKLRNSEAIFANTNNDLPVEAVFEKKLFKKIKSKSLMIIPMISNSELCGIVFFETVENIKSWSSDTLSLLNIVSNIYINTIERMQTEKELLDIFFSRLSEREIELLKYFACGLEWPGDKRLIGKKMDVLPGTLDKFMARVKDKMSLENTETVIKISRLYLADHIFNA